MKKLTILLPLFTFVTTPLMIITSCGNEQDIQDEHAKFIHDRTFSIMGIGESKSDPGYVNLCFGTFWIIDDSTPNTVNDYKYYVATNWHVVHGNDTVKDSTVPGSFQYMYADSSLSSYDGIIDFRNYKNFASCQKQNESYFTYDLPAPTYNFKPCIDMYVYSVDFGNPSGSIKEKLNRLNQLKQNQGYINEFINSEDIVSGTEQEVNTKMYVGGYPAKDSSNTTGGKWECRALKPGECTYLTRTKVKNEEYPVHKIGDQNEAFYYFDTAPQFACDVNKGTNWMTGGASGSMLITEDFKVCGIYWGGWGDDTQFWPHFSLFKTRDHDFISQWLTNN